MGSDRNVADILDGLIWSVGVACGMMLGAFAVVAVLCGIWYWLSERTGHDD